MIGSLVLLIAFGVLALIGTVVLMLACWLANLILGTRPPQPAIAAQVVGPTPVYRTVDAGPYTSPTTGHDGPTEHDARADGIPAPGLLLAFAITALSGLLGGLTVAAMGLVVRLLASGNGNMDGPVLILLGIGALVTLAIHMVLLVMLLPTTFLRGLLVAALEMVPMGFIFLVLFGMAFLTWSVRSPGPPPPIVAPAPARSVAPESAPTAPMPIETTPE